MLEGGADWSGRGWGGQDVEDPDEITFQGEVFVWIHGYCCCLGCIGGSEIEIEVIFGGDE